MSKAEQPELTRLTVELLSAFVANNAVPSSELPGLIETTRAALAGNTKETGEAVPHHIPAVSVKDSLSSNDHIVSLIDGRPYKALKRHLASNGLTPEQYKARYNLPADYPLVAPSYSDHRRKVAKAMGLGGKAEAGRAARKTAEAVKAPTEAAPANPKALTAAMAAAEAPGSKQPAARKRAVKAKKAGAGNAAAETRTSKKKSAAPAKGATLPPAAKSRRPDMGTAVAMPAAKPARKLALLKGLMAEAIQGNSDSTNAVASPVSAEPKPSGTGSAPGAAEASPTTTEKLVTRAKANPARKMAHPKSAAAAPLQAEATASRLLAVAGPSSNKTPGVKSDSLTAETSSSAAASPVTRTRRERKARPGIKGGSNEGVKLSPAAAKSSDT